MKEQISISDLFGQVMNYSLFKEDAVDIEYMRQQLVSILLGWDDPVEF